MFKQKILGFPSIMCVFWRNSLEMIQYDIGRSVQYQVQWAFKKHTHKDNWVNLKYGNMEKHKL